MNKIEKKQFDRARRHHRIRARVVGTTERPRLAVFRSARHITAQLIDDTTGVTLAAVSDAKETNGTKVERARKVGAALATLAGEKGIAKAVFDRGGFLYAGRVRTLAEAARAGGLEF